MNVGRRESTCRHESIWGNIGKHARLNNDNRGKHD